MTVFADPIEGQAIVNDLRDFEIIKLRDFGHLYFALDCAELPMKEANDLIDLLNDLDPSISVYIDSNNKLELDCWCTVDGKIEVREIIDSFTIPNGEAVLLEWRYEDAPDGE